MAKTKTIEFPKQYGSMGSANRFIKNFETKYGNRFGNLKFAIERLDEGCFEVNVGGSKTFKITINQ
jgi:hypothetical protein